jgi:hypothetical protein
MTRRHVDEYASHIPKLFESICREYIVARWAFTFVYSRMIGRDVSIEGFGSTQAAKENSPLNTSTTM